MRFAIIVHLDNATEYESGKMPSRDMLATMNKFNTELVEAGIMLSCDGFQPSAKGLRVHFDAAGNKTVTSGPFAKATGVIGGFWIWRTKSREEALEWAKRAPMEAGATLEIRQLFEPSDFDPEVEAMENALLEKLRKN